MIHERSGEITCRHLPGPNRSGKRRFEVINLTLPVLFITDEIVDTFPMEISSGLSTPNTGPMAVDQSEFGEFLYLYAGVCFGLATSLLTAMALVGIALPLIAVAVLFLTARSLCLSMFASRPNFLYAWIDHLANRAK